MYNLNHIGLRLRNLSILAILLLVSRAVLGHCDTMDGPVIEDAKRALESGDVTPALKWVAKDSESEIKTAFQKAVAVRGNGDDARELADTYFFETLVRVHRAGEGEPFEGIKPVGTQVEPGIEAADKAIEAESADQLLTVLTDKVIEETRERFAHVMEARKHRDESVDAGRAYVEAYVSFVHYVEALYQTAAADPLHKHGPSTAEHEEAPRREPRHLVNANHQNT